MEEFYLEVERKFKASVLILIIRFHYSLIERAELYDFVFFSMCSTLSLFALNYFSFKNLRVVHANKTKSVRVLTYMSEDRLSGNLYIDSE